MDPHHLLYPAAPPRHRDPRHEPHHILLSLRRGRPRVRDHHDSYARNQEVPGGQGYGGCVLLILGGYVYGGYVYGGYGYEIS